MELDKFIENFASNFEDTDVDSFTPKTKFRDLDEWTSMMALSTMAMVNEEYDVDLSADEMRNAETIEDLYNTTKSHM